MNTVERIKSICKERKIAISKLEKDCGFSNGYIGQLKKGTVPDDRLRIIADYLKISSEELSTGRKPEYSIEMATIDVELSNMNERFKEYALKLANLPKDKQEHVMSLIDMLK